MKYFLLLIFFPAISFAQRNTALNNSILKLNTNALIDITTFPTVQFSYERQMSNSISLAGELGYQFYTYSQPDTSLVPFTGYKANIELRCYNFLKHLSAGKKDRDDLTGLYAALNIFYRRNRENLCLLYSPRNEPELADDCMWSIKRVAGFNIIFGTQNNISKKLVIDIYAGGGTMKRTANNFHREYVFKQDIPYSTTDINFAAGMRDTYLSESNGWRTNISFGLRLGLRL